MTRPEIETYVLLGISESNESRHSSVSATQHEEGCAQEDPDDHTGDQNCSTGEAVDDDDEHIFITSVPSWHTSHTAQGNNWKGQLANKGKEAAIK